MPPRRRFVLLAAAAAAALAAGLAACGGGGNSDPQAFPGRVDQLVTPRQVRALPAGSPQRALLEWWRSAQFGERRGFLRGFATTVRRRLAAEGDLPRGLETFSQAMRAARPRIEAVQRVPGGVTIFTTVVSRRAVGAKNHVEATDPQAFALVRERGRWVLADDQFFRSALPPNLSDPT